MNGLDWFWLYWGIGCVNYGAFLLQHRDQFFRERDYSNHVVLTGNGNSRPYTWKDEMLEELVQGLFFMFAWPAQFLFRFVFVPIHDYLAGRAWKRHVESDEYWRNVPDDLR